MIIYIFFQGKHSYLKQACPDDCEQSPGFFREESKTILFCYDRTVLKKIQCCLPFLCLVPLGSVPELPAESCAEIRASEGENAVSGNYWFDSIKPGEVVLARCDMSKLGN